MIDYNNTYQMWLLFLILVTAPVSTEGIDCLLKEPITTQCLNSVISSEIGTEMNSHLCIITYQRELYHKTEEFCNNSYKDPLHRTYLFFSLLRNEKYAEAL